MGRTLKTLAAIAFLLFHTNAFAAGAGAGAGSGSGSGAAASKPCADAPIHGEGHVNTYTNLCGCFSYDSMPQGLRDILSVTNALAPQTEYPLSMYLPNDATSTQMQDVECRNGKSPDNFYLHTKLGSREYPAPDGASGDHYVHFACVKGANGHYWMPTHIRTHVEYVRDDNGSAEDRKATYVTQIIGKDRGCGSPPAQGYRVDSASNYTELVVNGGYSTRGGREGWDRTLSADGSTEGGEQSMYLHVESTGGHYKTNYACSRSRPGFSVQATSTAYVPEGFEARGATNGRVLSRDEAFAKSKDKACWAMGAGR